MIDGVSYSKSIKRDMIAYRMKNNCCRENVCRAMRACVPSAIFRDGEVAEYYGKLSHEFCGEMADDPVPHIKCAGCRAAILRGIFLAAGSVSDPERHEANLDLSFRSEETADMISSLLSSFGFDFRKRKRRGSTILYMKSGEAIGGFFAEAGINRVLYDVSNEALISDVANFANRRSNTDMYNLSKSTEASERACAAIRYLISTDKLDALGDELAAIARLRLENPELTLSQLAAVSPTGISKSALASKLKRIEAYAFKNAEK